MVLALSVRSIYFSQTINFIQPGSGGDGHFYLQWAEDILRGNVLGRDVFYALPVYPYFLSLAYLFSGGETFGLLLINILIGAASCGLIYILGKKLFNNSVGIIASIFACGYSMFIFYDRMLLPASLTVLLGLFLALLLLKARDKPGLKKWFAAGLLSGLCTLTGASFSLLAAFILIWIILEYKKDSLRQSFLYCASFILAFFLIIGGAVLRNYLLAGDAALITAHSGINFYIGNNAQANGLFKPPCLMPPTQSGLIEQARIVAEQTTAKRLKASEVSNFWFKRSLGFIKTQPWAYLRLLGKKFTLFWRGTEYIDEIEYYIYKEEAKLFDFPLFNLSLILPLAISGMLLCWPQRRKVALLYAFVFGPSLAVILFFINSRYRLIIVPYLIIFAASACWRALKMFRNKKYKSFIGTLIIFSLLYFLTNIDTGSAGVRSDFSLHYSKAVLLSDRQDYQKAQKQFHIALRLNPLDFMSYLGLGNVYYQMQDFSGAIDNYRKALRINPYFYTAHFNLGILYQELGREREAEEEFRETLKFKPKDSAAHYNLGRIYQEKGLIDLALKEYQEALKIEPGHQEILQAIEELAQ